MTRARKPTNPAYQSVKPQSTKPQSPKPQSPKPQNARPRNADFQTNSKRAVKSAIGARKKARTQLLVVVALAGGVLVPLGMLVGFLDGYGAKNRARRADAIVVLGAQVRPDGSAGHGLQSRALHALRLYRKGFAPKVICTGGVGDNPPAEAQAAAKILLSRGLPRTALLLENKSTSTWENAVFAARICKAHGWRKVIVVSDPFHLWRAEHNFARNGVLAWGAPVEREQWSRQPARKFFWTTREAILVIRDWCLRRV
jgi:uncharacterized SAM-binding protein YcdF (DUF218 family)